MGVRIAGGQGFYGDTPRSIAGLLDEGIDYLCLEALAELTLAILQKDRQKDEARGYTRDLPAYLQAALPAVATGRTKVITNAGGINPAAATRAAVETARGLGLSGITIATVLGDDLTARLDELAGQTPLANLESGAPFSAFAPPVLFASAYLGAKPIVDALAQGADVVITGRVADAALFLAPLVHEHGWSWDDWDRLASGTLVGHLLECSGQSAGGNLSVDWATVPRPWDLPYPIAEVEEGGTATITKPASSGGRVSFDTVRHQLLYEVHDPAAYLTPDVVADIADAEVHAVGADRVALRGVRGHARPAHYKVNVCHEGGWLAEGEISYAGARAEARARLAAEVLRRRLEGLVLRVDLIGAVSIWGDDAGRTLAATPDAGLRDVRLRVAATHDDRAHAERVAREVMALYTCGPAGGGGVRTALTPRLNTISCLLPRESVPVRHERIEEAA